MAQPTTRADRILDAAGELMVRLGSRKVTIDDIARRAGIGKGTVYLHWRTKDQLFEALLLRESVTMLTELTEHMRRDPEEVRPHRYLRNSFRIARRMPLLHAVITGDLELLGNLKHTHGNRSLHQSEHYHELIVKYGLVHPEVPNLRFALSAAATGFFVLDNLNPVAAEVDDEAKADALSYTIRHAFEPVDGPDPDSMAAAAAEISELFEEICMTLRDQIYPHPAA